MDTDDTQDEGREHTGPEDPTQPMGAQGSDGRPAPRKLVRAQEGRVLGGVCAGLGRYFNVDPILFRVGRGGPGAAGRRRTCCSTSPR